MKKCLLLVLLMFMSEQVCAQRVIRPDSKGELGGKNTYKVKIPFSGYILKKVKADFPELALEYASGTHVLDNSTVIEFHIDKAELEEFSK